MSAWFLVAYDVIDPRRLRRIHRLLRGQGAWVQRSVFLVPGTSEQVQCLMDELAHLAHLREDDLRAWPITEPSEIWYAGLPVEALPLVGLVPLPALTQRARQDRGWVARVLEWWHER